MTCKWSRLLVLELSMDSKSYFIWDVNSTRGERDGNKILYEAVMMLTKGQIIQFTNFQIYLIKKLTCIKFWWLLRQLFAECSCSSITSKWAFLSSNCFISSAIFFSYLWVVSASAFLYAEFSVSWCYATQRRRINQLDTTNELKVTKTNLLHYCFNVKH